MRKKLQLLLILLTSIFYKSQDNILAAMVSSPASYQTGVPDVSFPLLSLPATKDLNINIGLAYNPNGYSLGEFSGLIARNWYVSGSNFTITRTIVNNITDEAEMNYPNRPCDDVYYFNINGEQGSFKFKKNSPTNLEIISLTPTNLNILFTREDAYPYHVSSFTIKDSRGYSYYFPHHDIDVRYGNYRNSFRATTIKDSNDRIVATFQNKKFEKAYEGSRYMLEKITTDYGSIKVGLGPTDTNFDFFDRYYYKDFELTDHNQNSIMKVSLMHEQDQYHYTNLDTDGQEKTHYTRKLKSIEWTGKDSAKISKVDFGYSGLPPERYGVMGQWGLQSSKFYIPNTNPNLVLHDLLVSVVSSDGKRIEYNYGANEIADKGKNTSAYIQKMQSPTNFSDFEIEYIGDPITINFDTKIQIDRKYFINSLTVLPTLIFASITKIELYPFNGGYDPQSIFNLTPDPFINYKVKNAYPDYNVTVEHEGITGPYIVSNNGISYFQINGAGRGFFTLFKKKNLPPPYLERKLLANTGVKIEKIIYSMRKSESYSDINYIPVKTIDFDYSFFNEPGVPSGMDVPDQRITIIYKNVKVTESDKKGYTRYYYKIPDDYPHFPNPGPGFYDIYPNYDIIKKGLLDKKEIYDEDHHVKHLTKMDYQLPAYDINKLVDNELLDISGNGVSIATNQSHPEKVKTTETTYDNEGNNLTTSVEKSFKQNGNLMSEKRISADGTETETTYQYAAEKGNSKLLGANMFSVPLEVTQKQNDIQIGKLETKYDQAGNYFPSSVKSFGINNVVTGEQVNDFYDSMGNVLQTTSKSGIHTAIIWGYGNTQPIAKIEGGEYYDILSLLGQPDVNLLDIVQRSNQDVSSTDNTNEQLLRDALEAFRKKPAFKNYLITTYTYDPLIGVKSVTTLNGMTEYYYYDNQNRMIRVEDTDHHIIKENKYQQNVFQD